MTAGLRKEVANDYQTRYQLLRPAEESLSVYICICNALTDRDIHRAAKDDGAKRPAEVFAACRCRAQCGTCVRNVCAILGLRDAETASPQPDFAAAAA